MPANDLGGGAGQRGQDAADLLAPAAGQQRDARPVPAPRPPSYVNVSDIKVAYSRPYLAEEAEVDQYVNALRKTLMAEIAAGKKVIV